MMNFFNQLSDMIFLAFIVGIPMYAAVKKINVFDSFIDGAKDGFQTAVNLIPYLIAMIVAIGMLKASGFFGLLEQLIRPLLEFFNIPLELIPLIMIRPFSGSAANGILADIIHQFGGDASISKIAATLVGSTETTLYIVAVYFGAINIRHTRYVIAAGILVEIVGVVASLIIGRLLFS